MLVFFPLCILVDNLYLLSLIHIRNFQSRHLLRLGAQKKKLRWSMYVFDLLRNCSQETRKKQDMDMKKWTIDIISGQVPQTHGGTQKNKLPFRCTLLRTRELPFHTLVSVCHNYRDSGDLGETLREGNGTPLQYSCLENPMDGGAWWAAVHEVAESWTWLRDFTFTLHFHALEKEMATHSSVLTWRIPGGAWWAAIYGVAQSDTTEAT